MAAGRSIRSAAAWTATPRRPPPLIVAQKTLKWFVASCLVGKSYKIGKALHLQLRCTNEGAYRSLPVRLDLVAADRLAVTWDGQRVKDMRRCR
ncbi:MAG: hypothetical protein M5U33_05905 [Pseudorhodoplanes sp.]|nr:hypothetical protein [Pseudorhodoplanes sp.]